MAEGPRIHGQILEVTVIGCSRLKDTERWLPSRQDPYASLEYAASKFRTRTCTDGGTEPSFNEKFVFSLVEGLREMNVTVWNSNSFSRDSFIASGRVQLQKVLSGGFDDMIWPLQTRSGKPGGEIRILMKFETAEKPSIAHQTPHPYNPPPCPYPSHPSSSIPIYSAPSFHPPPPSPHHPQSYMLHQPYPPPPPAPQAYPPPPYGYPTGFYR